MLQADDIDQVHAELASAVQNSCYDNVVEAVAMACLDGLNECSACRGYWLNPVSFANVGVSVREDCPEVVDWKLTDLLQTSQCQQYFTVMRGPPRSQPHIIADLRSLIWKACRPRVQHVLQKLHPSQIHPQDASYDTEPRPVVTQHTRVEQRAATVETSFASSSRVCLDGAAVASSSWDLVCCKCMAISKCSLSADCRWK